MPSPWAHPRSLAKDATFNCLNEGNPDVDVDEEHPVAPSSTARRSSALSRSSLSATRSSLTVDIPTPVVRRSSVFEQSIHLSKAHALPLDVVQAAHAEFMRLDTDGDGYLQKDEFLDVVRKRLGLQADEAI